MTDEPIRVLYVDDQADFVLADWLRHEHQFEVEIANNGKECFRKLHESQGNFDVALLDLWLGPGDNGIDLMKEIRKDYPTIEPIIITGFASVKDGIQALKEGAFNYLYKPINREELVVYIHYAVERRRLKSNLRETAAQLKWSQGLLDISKAMISSLNSEEVAREICNQTRLLIPNIGFFYIARYDELRDEVRFLHTFDEEKRVAPHSRDLSDSGNWGLTGYIIKSCREPLYYDDLDKEVGNLHVQRLDDGKPSRTYIGIPLFSRDKLIGVLSAQSYQPNAFNESDKRLLAAIANQSAVAIENTSLHEEVSYRWDVLSKLYETLAALKTSLDLDEILDLIVSNLYKLLQLDSCTVGLLNQNRTELKFVAERGLEGKVTKSLKDLPADLVAHLFASSEPIVIPDLGQRQDVKNNLVRPDLNSFIILPLRGREEPLGIITLGSKGQIAVTSEQRDLFKALADQASIAIENARLHEQALSKAEQLEDLVKRVLDITSPTVSFKDLLRAICREATGILQGFGSGIYLLTATGEQLVLEAVFGVSQTLEGTLIKKGEGLAGQVWETRNIRSTANYSAYPNRETLFSEQGFSSVMGAPIISGDRLIGVLAVYDDQEGKEFGLEQQDLLVRFLKHAGTEIEKAKAHDELSRLSNERIVAKQITEALISELEYDSLLDKILATLEKSLGYVHCVIWLKDDVTNEL